MTNRFEGRVRRKGVSKMPGRGPQLLGCPRKLGSKVRINGLLHLHIQRVC